MKVGELEIGGLILSIMLLLLAALHLMSVIAVSNARQDIVDKMMQEQQVRQETSRGVLPKLPADPDAMMDSVHISRSPVAGFLLWAAGLIGILKGSHHLRWFYMTCIISSVVIIFMLGFFCVENCETNPGLMGQWEYFMYWIEQKMNSG